MTKRIFRAIMLVAGIILLSSLLIIMDCLYEYFASRSVLHPQSAWEQSQNY